MRPLFLLVPLALLCSCKRTPAPTPAASATASAPPRRPIVPSIPNSAIDAPRPVVPQILKVDCEALLGAARASRILGKQVVPVDAAKLKPMECGWASADGDAVVNAEVVCHENAVRMYRVVDRQLKEGARSLGFGHKSVLVEEDGQAVVRFVDDKSPCGAEVIATPAAKGAELSRAVFDGLHSALGR
jgi:hypothetical protein